MGGILDFAKYAIPGYGQVALALDAAQGIMNYISTEKTNEANEDMVRQTNQANREIAQINNQANSDLWFQQADYNSPKNQISRLQEAGFSPIAALGSSGFNSSMTPNPNQQVGNPMIANRRDAPLFDMQLGQNIVGSVQADAYSKKMLADAHMTDIQAGQEEERLKSYIHWLKKQGEISDKEADLKEYDLMKKQQTYNADVVKVESEAYRANEEAQKAKFDRMRSEFEYDLRQKYGESEVKKQLAILDSQKKEIDSLSQYYREKGYSERSIRAQIAAYINNIDADTELKRQLHDYNEEANPERLKVERREGQQGFLGMVFDSAHFMDMLYNDLYESNFSVEEAREQLNLLKEHVKFARKQNMYYDADKIEGYIKDLQMGIRTAKSGRLDDARVQDLQRQRKKRTSRTFYDRDNRYNGRVVEDRYY